MHMMVAIRVAYGIRVIQSWQWLPVKNVIRKYKYIKRETTLLEHFLITLTTTTIPSQISGMQRIF
jgi:hypothetical protein